MNTLPLFQVDAFTGRLFGGNPAAMVLLEDWLPDSVLQAIAAENNLAETAFVIVRAGSCPLRWFTPTVEMDLCGHATLASAHVLFRERFPDHDRIDFDTLSGRLGVLRGLIQPRGRLPDARSIRSVVRRMASRSCCSSR